MEHSTKSLLGRLALAIVSIIVLHMLGHTAHGVILATATLAWPDANIGATPVKRGVPGNISGGQTRTFAQNWAKAAADGNGTIYYLAQIPADGIVRELKVNCAALAGCTSVDLGVYRLNRDGTVANTAAGAAAGSGGAKSDGSDAGAIFMNAKDISGGKAIGSEQEGLSDLGVANLGVSLWKLLGFTDPKLKDETYILGMRLNTAGGAAGALAIRGSFTQA